MESESSGVAASVGGAFDTAIQSFLSGFPVFALHTGVTLAMLAVATTIYVLLTPHHEMRLIRAGNPAAAISLGGVIAGLALPLAVCMATSLNWADIVIWGAATLLTQLLTFRVVDLLLPGLSKRISDGETAAATLLAAAKLSAAFVLAAAVAGMPLARF